jgi:integrase
MLVDRKKDGSFASQKDRKNALGAIGKELKSEFKIQKIENLKQKHIQHLVLKWQDDNLSNATIKNRMAHLRWAADAMGKDNLIPAKNSDLGIEDRHIDYNNNKSWEPSQALKDSLPERLSLQVDLMREFGMRFKEAALFRPLENSSHDKIQVIYGTKGGRDREFLITNKRQEEVLERAREYVRSHPDSVNGNLLNPLESYKKFEDSARNTYRDAGIVKHDKGGVGSCHGLRHKYAQDRYEEMTGWKCPASMSPEERLSFRDSMTPEMRELEREKMLELSKELGHSRIPIVYNYIGSWSN